MFLGLGLSRWKAGQVSPAHVGSSLSSPAGKTGSRNRCPVTARGKSRIHPCPFPGSVARTAPAAEIVGEADISRLYPDGFPGWELEHGGVLETSLMLALYPTLVDLSRAVDVEPAQFPPYDVYPAKPEWTPASGTLSSPKDASAEKGELLLDVCTKGIVAALRAEFGTPCPA
ncbi:creatininase family protein [Paracoccus denitrificans]|uniref:creatininase family protein n=1 Tax=Paracoccus denitrificans TaxID=266 RepID=UPI002278F11F|nr:creatininase family protein [Paracoccus denitrificans]